MAEVYWDMEWTLQQQGFDLCYDKRLYDRLVHDPPDSVRGHLQADGAYQQRLIRFIENHDEPRAALTFGPARGRAAAVVMSTLPGARLYHDGQLEGFRTHLPIQLGREPDEPSDPDLRSFYGRLLRATAEARAGLRRLAPMRLHNAARRIHTPSSSRGAGRTRRRAIWWWSTSHPPTPRAGCDCRGDDLAGRTWGLADRLSEDRFTCSGDELAREGLRVTLDGWGSRFLALET